MAFRSPRSLRQLAGGAEISTTSDRVPSRIAKSARWSSGRWTYGLPGRAALRLLGAVSLTVCRTPVVAGIPKFEHYLLLAGLPYSATQIYDQPIAEL